MTFVVSIGEIVAEDPNGLLGIHPRWTRVTLSLIATILNGYAFPSTNFSIETGMPLIRIRNILQNRTDTYYTGQYDDVYIVQSGELIIGMDGDFNCTLWGGQPALLNQRVCKVTPDERFYDLRFLFYALPGYLAAINANTPSLTVKHLSSKTVSDIPLPLPSLAEQRRIVSKLEELFSDLDAGVAALERVEANLKRYRAAVLKAAIEGKLTEQWRNENPPSEPASELVKRILAERRKKWEEEQLVKYEVERKNPPKKWREKYKEPIPPDTAHLVALPDGWTYMSLEQLSAHIPNAIKRGPFGSAIKKEFFTGSGYKVYEQQNAIYNDFRRGTYYIPPAKYRELEAFKVQPGDLIVSCSGTIGKVAIVPENAQEGVINQALLKLALNRDVVLPRYFCAVFDHMATRILAGGTRGSAMSNLSGVIELKRVAFPIPSLSEQREIINRLDEIFRCFGQVEALYERNRVRASRLRQAILKRAFEGNLVEQDPTDEPADVLLQRIKAEVKTTGTRGGKSRARRERRNTRARRRSA